MINTVKEFAGVAGPPSPDRDEKKRKGSREGNNGGPTGFILTETETVKALRSVTLSRDAMKRVLATVFSFNDELDDEELDKMVDIIFKRISETGETFAGAKEADAQDAGLFAAMGKMVGQSPSKGGSPSKDKEKKPLGLQDISVIDFVAAATSNEPVDFAAMVACFDADRKRNCGERIFEDKVPEFVARARSGPDAKVQPFSSAGEGP